MTSIDMPKPGSATKGRAVIVLGMHRSGTSAIAGVLERLGCATPVSQIDKGDQNPRGFFESKKIARHNDSVLASAGSNWHDWRAINPNWIDSAPVQGLADEAVGILAEEFGDAPLIALKDPRLCRLVDYWSLVFDKAGMEPLFLNIHRNPVEVTQSLLRRNNFDPSFSMLLWLRHVIEAEAATRGRVRFFTSFEQLLQNWAGVTTRAQEVLGLSFPRMSESTAVEVEEFLSKELRHYVEPADQLIANPLISDWIRKSFEILDRWARRGVEENVDYAELDRIRAQFNSAAPAFSRFALVGETAIKDLHIATQRVGQTEKELDRVQADREHLRQQIDQLSGDLQQREAQIEEMAQQDQELSHEVDQLNSALRQRQAEADDAGKENDALRTELENRLRELGELARLLTDTETKHENTVAKHEGTVAKLRAEIDQLNKNVAKRKAEAAQNAARAREAWDDREAVLNSTSWRLTAPLRRIVDAFRGT